MWEQLAITICQRHQLSYHTLQSVPQGENIIFLVDHRLVIKIFQSPREGFAREQAALEFFTHHKIGVPVPQIVHAGEIEGKSYLVITQLSGVLAKDVWAQLTSHAQSKVIEQLGVALKNLHTYPAPLASPALNRDWPGFIAQQAQQSVARQRACHANPAWLARLPNYLDTRLNLLPSDNLVMLHGDAHLGNLLLTQTGGSWQISGLFDLADALCGRAEYDFVTPGVLIVQGNRTLQRVLLAAYGYQESQLDEELRARLMLLTILYECSDLRKYALRLRPDAIHLTLDELERAIWAFC